MLSMYQFDLPVLLYLILCNSEQQYVVLRVLQTRSRVSQPLQVVMMMISYINVYL